MIEKPKRHSADTAGSSMPMKSTTGERIIKYVFIASLARLRAAASRLAIGTR